MTRRAAVLDQAQQRVSLQMDHRGISLDSETSMRASIESEEARPAPLDLPLILRVDASFAVKSIVTLGQKVEDGRLVEGVKLPWYEIVRRVQADSNFLYEIEWWQLEELIAGAYKRKGWPEVILTPRSGDEGRDIIASWPGIGAIRIIEQVKAYSKGRVVTPDEVRSVLGALELESNASKAVISTSSRFAPSIYNNERLRPLMPYRLELRDQPKLIDWLSQKQR